MKSSNRRLLIAVWAVAVGCLVAMPAQAVWMGLIASNLRTTPAVPWAVVVMAFVLWLMWQYLRGRGWPRSTSAARARLLRAKRAPAMIFAWALLAGGFSMAALAGYWIVLGRCVRIPVSAVPDISEYPWQTTTLFLVMGALVSALLEQAGFFGYCQGMLEREFSGLSAIVILSVLFALLPHPPPGVVLVPKLLFFFLTAATFAVLAYLTNSILPGIVVHSLGLLSFFIFLFPYDTTRPLIAETGTDAWFWAHVAQMIVCAALALVAFCRLAKITVGKHARFGTAPDD
jgi:membrane protease YdiL (CAAX protease family)